MIENEKIKAFIEYDLNAISRRNLLRFLFMMLVISIPSGYFGIHAEITKIIIFPIIFVFIVWGMYLFTKASNKKIQGILFMGIFSIFISLSFLLGAYKIASTEIEVSINYVLVVSVIYIFNNILFLLNVKRLIKNGYFIEPKVDISQIGIVFFMSILGLSTGKLFFRNMSQDKVVEIMVILLILLGLICSYGTTNLLKYNYIKIMAKSKRE